MCVAQESRRSQAEMVIEEVRVQHAVCNSHTRFVASVMGLCRVGVRSVEPMDTAPCNQMVSEAMTFIEP